MANLKSVQKGVFTLAANKASDTFTLSDAVDPTKTILFKGGVCIDDEGDRPSHTNIMVSLTDSTTITFERIDSHNAEVKISWYVVEFEEGVRVQRGVENFNNIPTRTENLASDTDDLKSFCLISYKTDGHHFGADDFCMAEIQADKKIKMTFGTSTTGVVSWQVVEVTNCGSVQSDSLTLNANQSSDNIDIASVDLTKSFLIFSYNVSGEGNPDALAIRGHLSAANQLTFERSASNSPISVDISWFVVEMTDGTTVQQKDITLAAGTESGDTTIDSVTIDETSVHIGSLQQFGKNERNVDEFGKAMITAELNAVDNVRHERGQANSAAGIWTFYVVQWAKNGGESMFIKGVRSPNRFGKVITAEDIAEDGPEQTFLQLEGSGSFISAEVSKRGGDTGDTFVILEIDGSDNKVVRYSFRKGRVQGVTEDNPWGIALLHSETNPDIETLTIGYPVPLHFQTRLKFYVRVDEPGVAKIVGNVVFADFERAPGPFPEPEDDEGFQTPE